MKRGEVNRASGGVTEDVWVGCLLLPLRDLWKGEASREYFVKVYLQRKR